MVHPLYCLPAALRTNETSNYTKDLQTAKLASKVILRGGIHGNECLKCVKDGLPGGKAVRQLHPNKQTAPYSDSRGAAKHGSTRSLGAVDAR
jgi:hypothetical protein